MSRLAAGVALGGALLVAPLPTLGCIVVESSPRMTFREAQAVYEAVAVGDWHFKVERIWRGPEARRVEAPFVHEEVTLRWDCTRQKPVQAGERYLLIVDCAEATRLAAKSLRFDCEAWAQPIDEAGDELDFLRGAPLLTPTGLARAIDEWADGAIDHDTFREWLRIVEWSHEYADWVTDFDGEEHFSFTGFIVEEMTDVVEDLQDCREVGAGQRELLRDIVPWVTSILRRGGPPEVEEVDRLFDRFLELEIECA